MMKAHEAFRSHPDRRHNTLGTGMLTRYYTVRLLCAVALSAHTGNQQKEIIMKDPTKGLICFGTRWVERHRSACSTQPCKNSAWDLSTLGLGANSQKSVYSGERRDEIFLLGHCEGLLKM